MPAACSAADHLKTRLGYVAAFLAGAVVAMVGATLVEDGSPSGATPPSAAGSYTAGSPAAGKGVLTPVLHSPADATKPILGADFACHPRPGESAQEEFQRILRELVQAPENERPARLALLLARIRERGEASVPVIAAYLRDGRNLSSVDLFGHASLFGGGSHYKDLRTFLYLTLAQLAEAEPRLRRQIAAQGLEHARHLPEALALADAAAADPATRQQAIDSIAGLINETSLFNETNGTMRAMVRLESTELVALLADFLERKPYHLTVEGFLGALWNFPDDLRLAISRRLAASEAVREKMRPESWQWLDLRDPSLRAVIVQDLQASAGDRSDHAEHARLTLLQKLGEPREAAQSRYHKFSIGSATPRPGAPDSREQIAARITLLDELAPFCHTLVLQAHREEARARLVARLAQP